MFPSRDDEYDEKLNPFGDNTDEEIEEEIQIEQDSPKVSLKPQSPQRPPRSPLRLRKTPLEEQ